MPRRHKYKKENYTVLLSRARLKLMKRIALVLGFQYLSTPPPAADGIQTPDISSGK